MTARAEEAPAVLCLHGFGGSGAAWAPVAAFLPASLPLGTRLLTPDLPGHGAAPLWDGRAPAKACAEAAFAFLDGQGVAAAHWVGHSLGGAAAILAAMTAPQRVLSLTLLSPGGIGAGISSERLNAWVAARTEAEIAAAFAGMAGPAGRLPPSSLAALLSDRRMPGRVDALRRMAETLSAGNRQGVFPPGRLAALAMPVSVLWGEADPVLPFAQAETIPPAWRLIPLPARGHMLLEEAPAEVAAALSDQADLIDKTKP